MLNHATTAPMRTATTPIRNSMLETVVFSRTCHARGTASGRNRWPLAPLELARVSSAVRQSVKPPRTPLAMSSNDASPSYCHIQQPLPVTTDADWTPPTMSARYLLFLVKIPGTEIYGIPAEPSRFRLDAGTAQAESKYLAATQRSQRSQSPACSTKSVPPRAPTPRSRRVRRRVEPQGADARDMTLSS